MVATAELQDIVLAAITAANLNRPDDAQLAIGPQAPILALEARSILSAWSAC